MSHGLILAGLAKNTENDTVADENPDGPDYVISRKRWPIVGPGGERNVSLGYRLTVPVFQRGLTTLSAYLDKAEAFASETGIDPVELVATWLAPDMPFSGQYQRATDSAKLAIARLTRRRCTEIRG